MWKQAISQSSVYAFIFFFGGGGGTGALECYKKLKLLHKMFQFSDNPPSLI
jgi:hypothetical protein